MVQPRYVNVDIRLILDVSEGSLDLRMSPRDDFLIVDSAGNSTRQVINPHLMPTVPQSLFNFLR